MDLLDAFDADVLRLMATMDMQVASQMTWEAIRAGGKARTAAVLAAVEGSGVSPWMLAVHNPHLAKRLEPLGVNPVLAQILRASKCSVLDGGTDLHASRITFQHIDHLAGYEPPQPATAGKLEVVYTASGLRLPRFREAGVIALEGVQDAGLPALRVVHRGALLAWSVRLNAPSLVRIGGNLVLDHARDARLDSLEEVGGAITYQGANGIYVPRLRRVNGLPFTPGKDGFLS